MPEKKIQELLTVLKKDEETLRNTILNANGQLQYNKKMQEALQQLLNEITTSITTKKSRRK